MMRSTIEGRRPASDDDQRPEPDDRHRRRQVKDSRREQAARFIAAAIREDRWDFRSLGTTLASPYLAAGRISAYVVFWLSAIHAGAGSLLVTEAGGTLSDLDGRPWTIRSDSFVGSATPDLHEELLDLARAAVNLPL